VIGQLEQHRRGAGDHRDGVEQRQRDDVPPRGRGDRRQRDAADHVRADKDRTPAMSIDEAAPHPCKQRAGERERDREQPEIQRTGTRDQDRGHRQRRPRHARADCRNALRAPEEHEVAVAP
jgi:hypothetical protein